MYLGLVSSRINPLTGKTLEDWQTLVEGPGGRLTVVDTRPGATLQPWIIRVPGGYQDTGSPLATDRPAQSLPELVATARGGWLWIVALLVGVLALRRARGAKEWR